MDLTAGINKHCIDRQVVRKKECNTNDNGGKYQIMTMREYISYQISKGNSANLETINGVECVKLYRSEKPKYHTDNPKNKSLYNERMCN